MRRPIGAWRHLEQSLSPWRQWFTKRPQPVMRAAGGQHEARP
jgi:hypothetical protein